MIIIIIIITIVEMLSTWTYDFDNSVLQFPSFSFPGLFVTEC